MKARTVSLWSAPRESDIPRCGQRNGDVRKTSALAGIACSGGRAAISEPGSVRPAREAIFRAARTSPPASRRARSHAVTLIGESSAWFATREPDWAEDAAPRPRPGARRTARRRGSRPPSAGFGQEEPCSTRSSGRRAADAPARSRRTPRAKRTVNAAALSAGAATAAAAARSGTRGTRRRGPQPAAPSQDHHAAVDRRTNAANPARASPSARRALATRTNPTAEEREREIEEEPLVRSDRQSPEAVERRMAERLAGVGREGSSEAHDLEREPRRRRRRKARAGCRKPARAARPGAHKAARTAGKRMTRRLFERSSNPARNPASAARRSARRGASSFFSGPGTAQAAAENAPPTHAAWSGSDQSEDAYAQSGEAIAVARTARRTPRASAPQARARRPAASAAEKDEEDLFEDEERLRGAGAERVLEGPGHGRDRRADEGRSHAVAGDGVARRSSGRRPGAPARCRSRRERRSRTPSAS